MAFMAPSVERGAWFVVETADGASVVVPADVVGDVVDVDTLAPYVESAPVSWERVERWGARLSAPGYMDCTPWTLHDTEAAARAELRDTYEVCPFTGDPLPCEESTHGPELVAHVEACAQCTDTGACECGSCNHRAPLPQSITVVGRRWFQRSAGNTYHTARVLVDGVTVWTSERTYGYGDHYLQTAAEWIYTSGIVPEPAQRNGAYPPLWRYVRDTLGIAFESWAEDVARQRDL